MPPGPGGTMARRASSLQSTTGAAEVTGVGCARAVSPRGTAAVSPRALATATRWIVLFIGDLSNSGTGNVRPGATVRAGRSPHKFNDRTRAVRFSNWPAPRRHGTMRHAEVQPVLSRRPRNGDL